MTTSRRMPYIDVLKIFAAWLVIVLHMSALYVDMDAPLDSVPQLAPYVASYFSRIALPIFMMMTGALLLRDKYKFSLRSKAFHLVAVYAIWSAVYLLIKAVSLYVMEGELYSASELFMQWIRGPYHFWYMVLLLGFYFLMPILSHLRGMQTLAYATFFVFVICFVYVPLSAHLPDTVNRLMGNFQLLYPTRSLFYFLCGAFMYRMPRVRNFLIASIVMFLAGCAGRYWSLISAETLETAMRDTVLSMWSELLIAVGLVYIITYAMHYEGNHPQVVTLSNNILYIYVMSPLVIYMYQYLIMPGWDKLVGVEIVSILLWSIVVFGLTYALRLVLVRLKNALPFGRKDKKL